MGVKGLTTFIEDNRRKFFNNEKVHDCPLVIDGFGLIYHLYFGANLDTKHGGEFKALTEVADRFFTNLDECSIKPYVIFDGPIDSEKLPCVLNRLQDRVKDVHNILKRKHFQGRLLPIFAVDTLLHYLWSHNIPHCATLIEADAEIVAVANYLNCPVLSEDSDYFIYNVKCGYIPLQHFYWEKIWIDKFSRRKSIICHKYHIAYMYDAYGIPVSLLPYLSVLLGNDWVDSNTFRQFIAGLPLMRSSSKQKHGKRKKIDARIESVLNWLSKKTGNESSVLRKMENCLPIKQREGVLEKIEICLAMYREEPDASKTLEVLGLINLIPDATEEVYGDIKDLVRRTRAHAISMNLLESNYICLPVIMSDSTKPSPHFPASEIRTLLYRVLLRKFRFKTVGAEFIFLQEYDKVEISYKKSRTVSVFTTLCPLCEQHHSLDDGCKMAAVDGTMTEQCGFTTLDLLLKMLGTRSDASLQNFLQKVKTTIFKDASEVFLTYLDILLTSTLIWVKKTSPRPDLVCALLLTVVWSINKSCFAPKVQSTQKIEEKPLKKALSPQNLTAERSTRPNNLEKDSCTGSEAPGIDPAVQQGDAPSEMDTSKILQPNNSRSPQMIENLPEKLSMLTDSQEKAAESQKICLETQQSDVHSETDTSRTSQSHLTPTKMLEGSSGNISALPASSKDAVTQDNSCVIQKDEKRSEISCTAQDDDPKPHPNESRDSPKTSSVPAAALENTCNSTMISEEVLTAPKVENLIKMENFSTPVTMQACAEDSTTAPEDSFSFEKTSKHDETGHPILSGQPEIEKAPQNLSEKEFLNLLHNATVKTASGAVEQIKTEFNIELLHSASQWLCVLNAALLLHQVVESSRSRFPMQEFLTSSVLLHDVHGRIVRLGKFSGIENEDLGSFSKIISDRLDALPQMKIVFQSFTEFLMQQ